MRQHYAKPSFGPVNSLQRSQKQVDKLVMAVKELVDSLTYSWETSKTSHWGTSRTTSSFSSLGRLTRPCSVHSNQRLNSNRSCNNSKKVGADSTREEDPTAMSK